MRDMDYKTYALMGILVASVAVMGTQAFMGTEAYAQTSAALTVNTDKQSYNAGETVTISGNVGTIKAGQPVLVKVTNPNGAIYRFDQVPVAADGSYTYPLNLGGKLAPTGEYKVEASYGTAQQTGTFTFTAGPGGETWKTINVKIGNATHPVQYKITGSGNSLNSMTGDVQEISLTGMLTTASDGTLTLKFPRETFDAKDPKGDDTAFVAFIDEINQDPSDVAAETDSQYRTISINIEAGSEEVVIIGTHIVPEFGAIAAIVLAIAIVGIIAVTARTTNKFSFLPKQ